MSTLPRNEQIRDDTLATLNIASEMVQAMFDRWQEKVDEQQTEIEGLRAYVEELEQAIDRSHESWLGYDDLKLSKCGDTELAGTTNHETEFATGFSRLL